MCDPSTTELEGSMKKLSIAPETEGKRSRGSGEADEKDVPAPKRSKNEKPSADVRAELQRQEWRTLGWSDEQIKEAELKRIESAKRFAEKPKFPAQALDYGTVETAVMSPNAQWVAVLYERKDGDKQKARVFSLRSNAVVHRDGAFLKPPTSLEAMYAMQQAAANSDPWLSLPQAAAEAAGVTADSAPVMPIEMFPAALDAEEITGFAGDQIVFLRHGNDVRGYQYRKTGLITVVGKTISPPPGSKVALSTVCGDAVHVAMSVTVEKAKEPFKLLDFEATDQGVTLTSRSTESGAVPIFSGENFYVILEKVDGRPAATRISYDLESGKRVEYESNVLEIYGQRKPLLGRFSHVYRRGVLFYISDKKYADGRRLLALVANNMSSKSTSEDTVVLTRFKTDKREIEADTLSLTISLPYAVVCFRNSKIPTWKVRQFRIADEDLAVLGLKEARVRPAAAAAAAAAASQN
jgi:hypothetical protein